MLFAECSLVMVDRCSLLFVLFACLLMFDVPILCLFVVSCSFVYSVVHCCLLFVVCCLMFAVCCSLCSLFVAC